LWSKWLLSYSRNSQQFIEPEVSLPCSQQPATYPYPEPDESSPHLFIISSLSHIYAQIILVVFLFQVSLPKRFIHFSHMHTTCHVHLNILEMIILVIFGKECKLCSSLLCSSLWPPITSSILGPNILLRTLFSGSPSLCSLLNVREKVSHPCKTTTKL
jgi:hypothetical protein